MEISRKKTVLIGSNGGLTGVYLAKQLKKNTDTVIIGADASHDSIGKFFVDHQFILPNSTDDRFIASLINLINKNDVDIYLPTHSMETRIVSMHEDELRKKTKCNFLVSPIQTFLALENKRDANENLKSIGIPVPAIIEDFSSEYPIFMKKEIGSGSSGSGYIFNRQMHEAYLASEEKVVFFEAIKGIEYTVDCIFDTNGVLLGYNQRRRTKTIGGAVNITENDNTFNVEPYIIKIAKTWKLCGCVNFQYILKDDIPFFIDVNLRYPSGGLPLTVESGLNIPRIIISLLSGVEIDPKDLHLCDEKRNLKMYRYFEEIFAI